MINPSPKTNLLNELLQILSSESSQAIPQIIRTLLHRSMDPERNTALHATPYQLTFARKGYDNG